MLTDDQAERKVQEWYARAATLERLGMHGAAEAVRQCARELDSENSRDSVSPEENQ